MLGSGCFWGREYHLRQLPGVIGTQVGFAGGHTDSPGYHDVCSKDTGHAEVVAVRYDPEVLPTEQLLTEFFALHNFEINRGKGTGQYRSAVFSLREDEQLSVARSMIDTLRERGFDPATDVNVVPAFYRAEARHQQYCSARGLTPKRRNDDRIRRLFTLPESTENTGNQSVS
ncbi:peptide-methionine (S)-S-oxide reductase MsrA [Lewinella sp. IMCC34191]|uniref:peptide-methionine (S)-S-oxide reductase MsrA n=1 Tax=Lewinella sp. IMCC34191 TaxID=2259172 RepID=UPI00210738B3|nr:peptide-methionine (S)-S-oxide reductase MsrA [Lewinella sp. IMCC34191]